MGSRSFLGGVAVGAGLMYLLDPDNGAERRIDAQQRLDEVRDGMASGRLGRVGELVARGGSVRFRRDDIEEFGAHGARTGTRGAGRVRASSAVVGVAGGAIAAYGIARRGRLGGAMRKVGTTMLVAGLKDFEAGPLGLLRERRQAVDAHRSVDVAAGPDAAYTFWRDYENFPLFLSHVKEVTDLGGGRSHWTVDGPAGVPVTWTARVTEDIPNRLLAWASEPGSSVENSGTVRFTPRGAGTRVDVRICYAPPAGAAGKAVAKLLGADPGSRLDQDLARVKVLLDLEGRRSDG